MEIQHLPEPDRYTKFSGGEKPKSGHKYISLSLSLLLSPFNLVSEVVAFEGGIESWERELKVGEGKERGKPGFGTCHF